MPRDYSNRMIIDARQPTPRLSPNAIIFARLLNRRLQIFKQFTLETRLIVEFVSTRVDIHRTLLRSDVQSRSKILGQDTYGRRIDRLSVNEKNRTKLKTTWRARNFFKFTSKLADITRATLLQLRRIE